MTDLVIQISKVRSGATLHTTVEQAIKLATVTGCDVEFTFNGTSLIAEPVGSKYGSVDEVVEYFYKSREQ